MVAGGRGEAGLEDADVFDVVFQRFCDEEVIDEAAEAGVVVAAEGEFAFIGKRLGGQDDAVLGGALDEGDAVAAGFLLKNVTPEHLAASVRLVRTGDALLAPTITRRLVERFTRGGPHDRSGQGRRDLSALTSREIEVLEQMARGLSNTELAERFQVSQATIKTHVARILTKLRVRDRVQAVIAAYEAGLVTPEPVNPERTMP